MSIWGHGFCVPGSRICREDWVSDFACRGIEKAAAGRGFSVCCEFWCRSWGALCGVGMGYAAGRAINCNSRHSL